MKKLILTLTLSVLTGLLLSGCVQMHMVSEIDKDGSGAASLTLSLSQVVTESLEEIAEMDQEQEMDLGAMTEMNRKDLEASVKPHGVKIKEFENGIVDGKQTLHMAFEFKDLEGLSFAMSEVMGNQGGDGGMGIFATDDGNFVLKGHQYDWPAGEGADDDTGAADAPDAEMSPEMMQKQMALMGKLMGAMAEMDVSMKITVPGDVIESNAPTVEGRTSIWTINSSNMMSQDADMEPHIVFSGKDLKIKPLKE